MLYTSTRCADHVTIDSLLVYCFRLQSVLDNSQVAEHYSARFFHSPYLHIGHLPLT